MGTVANLTSGRHNRFTNLVTTDFERVRRALVARYGAEIGEEASADAVAWAWEHADELLSAENPCGLLYRVGQSKSRKHTRWARRRSAFELAPEQTVAERDPALVDLFLALSRLPERERIAVIMVHAHGERYEDVASTLGVSTAAVTNHVHRGLRHLRGILGEDI